MVSSVPVTTECGLLHFVNGKYTKFVIKMYIGTGVTVYAVNPGIVLTKLSRYVDQTIFPGASWLYNSFTKIAVKTPQQGAQTTLYCALDEKCAGESGLYYR